MKKLLLSLLVGSTLSFASMVNGIAILVNDEPITLYDIERTMVVNKVTKNEAVSYLIDKILYDQLVKEHSITVDIFEINEQIEKLAKSNGMDIYAFKAVLKQEYPDYSVFENEVKNNVIRQKLVQKLVRGQLAVATDEDMRLQYEKNSNRYLTAKTFDVIQYSSTSRESLVQAMQNPMVIPQDVQRNPIQLQTQDLPAQLQYLLTSTKSSSFTPVVTANKQYVSFFITKKEGTIPLSYESVQARIFNDIMMNREQKYLKDYFEKEKLTADIKVIR